MSKHLCALKTTKVNQEQYNGVGALCNAFGSDRFLSLNSNDTHPHWNLVQDQGCMSLR